MSSINVNTIKSRLGGPPTLPSGVVVSAAATFNNDVSIGGTLTYEDVTSVDVVGLITARSGIKFGVAGVGGTIDGVGNAIISGVSTFSGNIRVPDDKKLQFGNIEGANGDLQLWHDAGQHSYIRDQGSGDLRIYGSAVDIRDNAGTASVARFTDDSVHLAGLTTVGILTSYESITINVGSGSTEVATALKAKASTVKAIAMAMVFG